MGKDETFGVRYRLGSVVCARPKSIAHDESSWCQYEVWTLEMEVNGTIE